MGNSASSFLGVAKPRSPLAEAAEAQKRAEEEQQHATQAAAEKAEAATEQAEDAAACEVAPNDETWIEPAAGGGEYEAEQGTACAHAAADDAPTSSGDWAPGEAEAIGEPAAAPAAQPTIKAGRFFPQAKDTIEETGLNISLVIELVYKYLLNRGESTGRGCATALCLPPKPVIEILSDLKNKRHAVYSGSGSMGDFNYMLTEDGREIAKRYMSESMYVGAAPVTLNEYIKSVEAQSIAAEKPRRAQLDEAFSDLLINDEMFERLGPAINSGKGMLLYGFPGNGKTSIAERITKCFGTSVWIPHALFVEGTIIKFFDPETHEPLSKKPSIMKGPQADPRWIEIKRPTIVVGGELQMEALELRYNEVSKVTSPSLQLRSNCGTLVIDDFGRQRMDPSELLNRWIVPLEKRYDFLTLHNGKKIQVPFDQLIIFSTNLEPRELIDDAFLRRIPYKICVQDPSEQEFRELVHIMAGIYELATDEGSIDYLVNTYYLGDHKRPFRCCQPRDLLLQILSICSYHGEPPQMTPALFDKACDCYFSAME